MGWKETNIVPDTVEDKERIFMYVAEFEDGTITPEFDDDGTETNFKKVDKNKVSMLSLIGKGSKVCNVDTKTGILNVMDIAVSCELSLGDKKYPITGIKDEVYKDLIHYKGFITDGLESNFVGNAVLKCHTNRFAVGWKKQIKIDEERSIHFKVILNIIVDVGIQAEIKITPDFDIDGSIDMAMFKDGKTRNAVLETKSVKGASTEFKLLFK